jgi:hypothetical protein
VDSAKPTHLLRLTRGDTDATLRIERMTSAEVLSALLHQTVVPSDAITARSIIATVAATARSLSGMKVELGNDIYLEPDALLRS